MTARRHKGTQLRNVTEQPLLHKVHVIYTQQTKYSKALHYVSKSVSK